MKLSVIIPTYKPQEYLWKCLDSLCNQTFPKEDYELVIVLNGCKEPFDSEIKRYIGKRPEVKWNYIQIDVSGVSNARNMGIDIAQGDYIAFIDDDDFVSPTYLQELYTRTDNSTMALSYQLAFIDGKDDFSPYYITKEYDKSSEKIKLPFYKCRKHFNGPTYKLLSRTAIGDRRFDVSISNGEDALFMFLLSDKFKNVTFTTKNAVYYRRYREGSAISKRGNLIKRLKNALILITKYLSIYLRHPFSYNIYFMFSRIVGTLKTIH